MNLIQFLKKYPLVKSEKKKKKSAKPESKTEYCCPFCGKPLVKHGQLRLQTLAEHVYDPNGTPSLKDALYCENPDCKYGKYYCWNGEPHFGGEAFSNSEVLFDQETKTVREAEWNEYWNAANEYYINALNSVSCASERGEEYHILLHPALALGFVRPMIVVYPYYKEDGTFIKNKYKFSMLKKNEKGEYSIYGYSGITMFFFMIKHTRHTKTNFRKLKKMSRDAIVEPEKMEKFLATVKVCYGNDSYRRRRDGLEWWRTASEKYMRLVYPCTFHKCLKIAKNSLLEAYGPERGEVEYTKFVDRLNND